MWQTTSDVICNELWVEMFSALEFCTLSFKWPQQWQCLKRVLCYIALSIKTHGVDILNLPLLLMPVIQAWQAAPFLLTHPHAGCTQQSQSATAVSDTSSALGVGRGHKCDFIRWMRGESRHSKVLKMAMFLKWGSVRLGTERSFCFHTNRTKMVGRREWKTFSFVKWP